MGVLLAFVVLVILVYKKVPAALAAVIAGIVMCLLSGLNALDVMSNDFMQAAADFVKSWFLLFLVCGIYAAVMDSTGAAYSLGKWLANLLGPKGALWGVSAAAFVLTYGGISCFVIVFAMYPIALVLFKEANISRKMIPGAIAAGAFTLPNVLWGSPALCNVIPTQYLGTTVRSAPLVSIIVSVFLFMAANLYLMWKSNYNRKRGIGFVATEKIQKLIDENESRGTVSPLLAVIPLATIIVVLNVLKWHVNVAVLCGIAVAYALFWKRLDSKFEPLTLGTQTSISSVMGVAPVAGLGSVAKLTAFFQRLVNAAMSMQGSPLVSWALGCTLITAACGSGSAGGAMACTLLADKYLALGLNPEIMHKVVSCASIVFDSTPWNGTICLTMAACDCTHKDSYGDIFMITILINGLGLILCTALGVLLY